jgi:hypothetical protein
MAVVDDADLNEFHGAELTAALTPTAQNRITRILMNSVSERTP